MPALRRLTIALVLFSLLLSSCGTPATLVPTSVATIEATPMPIRAKPAIESGVYRNLFAEYLGKSEAEIQAKNEAAFQQLFYGDEFSERVYYPVGTDMAYLLDTGNDDVRSEGMSYGMMIAVQMNKKEEFDRIWKWTKTYMYQRDGGYKGYFAWHCKPDGTQLAANPASDGEVWFVMALFFADARWGSGEGIFDYRAEAQAILDVALNAKELGGDLATNLFDPETKQVVFVPQLGQNSKFTDASYHMPHFYELWARWADKNNDFWAAAVIASREFLPTAVHPETGLAPNYSYFDGRPYNDDYHGKFRYDAFRVGANIGMDYVWFHPSDWYTEQANRQLSFFASQGINTYVAEYSLDGKPLVGHRSTGLIATNAVLTHAADPEIGKPFVQALWDTSIPTGKYRYYDGLLYMLGLLQTSGNFRIYEPGVTPRAELPPPPRAIEGQFAPLTGRALLLVGPDAAGVSAYFDTLVTAPGGVNIELALQALDLDSLTALAKRYPNSTLSVGLSMDGLADSIAAGEADGQIEALLTALAATPRPVFLRLEPEFDATANNLQPVSFVAAWQTFHQRIQAFGAQHIALVWHSAAACEAPFGGQPAEAWYPGDEVVDWVAVSYGEQLAACENQSVVAVLQFARGQFKPVMLIATPTLSGDAWAAHLFEFVHANNDAIRALAYFNTAPGLFDSPEFLRDWKAETAQQFWLRGSPTLFSTLGE